MAMPTALSRTTVKDAIHDEEEGCPTNRNQTVSMRRLSDLMSSEDDEYPSVIGETPPPSPSLSTKPAKAVIDLCSPSSDDSVDLVEETPVPKKKDLMSFHRRNQNFSSRSRSRSTPRKVNWGTKRDLFKSLGSDESGTEEGLDEVNETSTLRRLSTNPVDGVGAQVQVTAIIISSHHKVVLSQLKRSLSRLKNILFFELVDLVIKSEPDDNHVPCGKLTSTPLRVEEEEEDIEKVIVGLCDLKVETCKKSDSSLESIDSVSTEVCEEILPLVGATCLDYYGEDEQGPGPGRCEDDEAEGYSDDSIRYVDALESLHETSDAEKSIGWNSPGPLDEADVRPGAPPNLKRFDNIEIGSDPGEIDILTANLNELHFKSKAPPRKTSPLPFQQLDHRSVYAYDPNNARHEEFYGDVLRTVSKLAQTIQTMPVPPANYHDDDDDEEECTNGEPNSENPFTLRLYDHQKYGLKWLSWREQVFPGGGILADEMGLGKTIMILALVMKSKEEPLKYRDCEDEEEHGCLIPCRSTLVICPVGCMLQWWDEICTKCEGLKVIIFHGPKKGAISATELAKHDIVLTTYATVGGEMPKLDEIQPRKRKSPLSLLYWERIVLDEAHNIRNPKTRNAQSICQLNSRHRWAVTGTPVHNYPEDFYSLVKFLRMTPFDDLKVWSYWIGRKTISKFNGAAERLHTIGRALILRRTKSEVASARIPPKNVEEVEIMLSEEEQQVYDHLMEFARSQFKDFMADKENRDRNNQLSRLLSSAEQQNEIRFTHLFVLILRLRQCAVLPHLIETMLEEEEIGEGDSFDELNDDHLISKRNPVFQRGFESSKFKRILEDLLELRVKANADEKPMDKVVIVSCWTSTLEILHEHLEQRGFSSVFITGKEAMNERMKSMQLFNKSPENPQIVLLSLTAGGVGLNLVGGNHVFIVEPHWNPQMELQAQDRVHRFGQKKPVTIRRYIVKGTIEDRVRELQQVKVEFADGILTNTKKSGGGLSLDQMKHLFSIC